MPTLESSSQAFRAARERASVAAALEASTLHMAICQARESGMSVRETATMLSVSKSTVFRHWGRNHHCSLVVPEWGSETAWREAHAMIWAHDTRERDDGFVPYEWVNADDGHRIVRLRPCGTAVLTPQE